MSGPVTERRLSGSGRAVGIVAAVGVGRPVRIGQPGLRAGRVGIACPDAVLGAAQQPRVGAVRRAALVMPAAARLRAGLIGPGRPAIALRGPAPIERAERIGWPVGIGRSVGVCGPVVSCAVVGSAVPAGRARLIALDKESTAWIAREYRIRVGAMTPTAPVPYPSEYVEATRLKL